MASKLVDMELKHDKDGSKLRRNMNLGNWRKLGPVEQDEALSMFLLGAVRMARDLGCSLAKFKSSVDSLLMIAIKEDGAWSEQELAAAQKELPETDEQ